jgi:hypothetical protein
MPGFAPSARTSVRHTPSAPVNRAYPQIPAVTNPVLGNPGFVVRHLHASPKRTAPSLNSLVKPRRGRCDFAFPCVFDTLVASLLVSTKTDQSQRPQPGVIGHRVARQLPLTRCRNNPPYRWDNCRSCWPRCRRVSTRGDRAAASPGNSARRCCHRRLWGHPTTEARTVPRGS